MILREKKKDEKIFIPEQAVQIFREVLAMENPIDQEKEHFWCMGLSTRNQVKYIDLVSLGILDACIVHPRETFRLAVMKGCSRIITCHNHPGGDPSPSPQDKEIDKRLQDAGFILGIKVIDSLIIGEEGFYSANSQLPPDKSRSL